MALELSYAGVALPLEDAALGRWVEARLSLDDLRELAPYSAWPGRNLAGLAFASHPPPPRARVGQLFYPSGLSRWAEARFVVSSSQLREIVGKAYGRPEEAPLAHLAYPQDLVLRPGVTGGAGEYAAFGDGIRTQLFLLPPRPVADFHPKLEGLYLITLVDERFYFRWNHGGRNLPDAGNNWASSISLLCQQLHINDFSGELAVDVAYGRNDPDSPFWSYYESAAHLLEAVLTNVGHTVARRFDGSYVARPWADARVLARAARRPELLAGGTLFNDRPDSPLRVRAAALVPRYVTVTFPRYKSDRGYINRRQHVAWFQESYGDVYEVTKRLDDLGAPYDQYWRFSSDTRDTRVLRDTAKAFFAGIDDVTPTNDAQLQALAERLAKDYFDCCLAPVADETYPGIFEWPPDGAHDLLYTFRHDRCQTRVLPRPWGLDVPDLSHTFTTSGLVPRDRIGGTDLTVEEADGAPSFGGVVRLVFDNGTVTKTEDGVARVIGTPGPPGGGLTIREVDLFPSVAASTFEVPVNSLTDAGGGVARLNEAGVTRAGVVTIESQQFSGLKQFLGGVHVGGTFRVYPDSSLTGTYADVFADGSAAGLRTVSLGQFLQFRLDYPNNRAVLSDSDAGASPAYAVQHPDGLQVGTSNATFTTADAKTVTVRGGLVVSVI
jgi:hypothetical protein